MVLNRIGVTGASGMLGRHICAVLENAGAQVFGVSRGRAARGRATGWDLAEWLTPMELDALFGDVQAVVHAGAMVPKQPASIEEGLMFDVNVRACVNLGQWAAGRGVPIVYVSGAIVYADHYLEDQKEDGALGCGRPGDFYGLSKLLAEDALKSLKQQGLRLAVVRPSSIYGYGLHENKMICRFLATARSGGILELVQPVHDRVDLIHAADVSRAILAILKTDSWDTFNIASGHPVSIKELAEACVSAAGRGSIMIKEGESPVRDSIAKFALNTDSAKNRLGWQPLLDINSGLTMVLNESVRDGRYQ